MLNKSTYWIVLLVLHNAKAVTKVEVAKGKTTDQSSVDNGGVASRAVDGKTAGLFKDGSCIMTQIEDNPWWQVDLGITRTVTDVVIYNRLDACCKSMLNKMEIRVGDRHGLNGNNNPVCVTSESLAGQDNGMFTCSPPLPGRFVNIRLEGRGKVLTFCEVQVFAQTSNKDVTPSIAVPTTSHVTTTKNPSTVRSTASAGLPDSVEMITIEDITSSSALISWLPPRPGTPEVTAYYVFYKPKNLEDTKYRKKIVRGQRYFVKLSELTSSTKYELEVVAGNSNGNTTRSETKTFKTLDTEVTTALLPTKSLPLIKNEEFQRILAILLAVIFLLLLILVILCCLRIHSKAKRKDEENNCSSLKTLAKERGKINVAMELEEASETGEQYVILNGRKNTENRNTTEPTTSSSSSSSNSGNETDRPKNHKMTKIKYEKHPEQLYNDVSSNTMKKMSNEENSEEFNAKHVFHDSEIPRAVTLSEKVELRNTNSKKTEEDFEKVENRKCFIRQGRLFSLGSRPITAITVENNSKEAKGEKVEENDHANRSKMESDDYVNLDTSENSSKEEDIICENIKVDCNQQKESDECLTKLLLEDLGVLSSNFKNFGCDADQLKETDNNQPS